MKRQRRRDDGGELGGLSPGPRRIGQPPGVRLASQDAVDQEGQGPGLEQVEPDAKEQQTQRKGYPPRVRPEVTQRPEQLAETPDGGGEVARSPGSVHTGNPPAAASHVPAGRGNAVPPTPRNLPTSRGLGQSSARPGMVAA